jgi:hypothetical protein
MSETPMTDEEEKAIERRAEASSPSFDPAHVDRRSLLVEVRRLRGILKAAQEKAGVLRDELDEGSDEVCETCINWTWDGHPNRLSGNCSEFACDGRPCPMGATAYCSRWRPRPVAEAVSQPGGSRP